MKRASFWYLFCASILPLELGTIWVLFLTELAISIVVFQRPSFLPDHLSHVRPALSVHCDVDPVTGERPCIMSPLPCTPLRTAYTRDELYLVQPATLDPSVISRLGHLCIGVNLPRKRSRRGGRRKRKKTPVTSPVSVVSVAPNLSSRFHRPTPPRRRLLTSSLVYQRLPRPSLSRLPASPSRHQSPSSCNLCLSPTPPTAVMSLAGHIAISTASFTPLSRTACYMPLLPTASSTPLSPTASAMSVSPTERATLMVPTPATSPTASATSPAPTSLLASPASYHGITMVASSTRKRSSVQSSTSRVPMQDTLLPFPFMTLAHHKHCFSLSLSSTPDPLAPQGKRPRFAISSLTMMYTSCF